MSTETLDEIGEIPARIPLFSAMMTVDKRELSELAHRKSFQVGDVIFHLSVLSNRLRRAISL